MCVHTTTTNPINKHLIPVIHLLALACVWFSPNVLALDSDARAPIDIHSDAVAVDNKTQQATYTGNVSITQGSIKIKAQKVVIKAKQGRLHSADIYGNSTQRASFEQTTEKGERITGKAMRIQLNQIGHLLTLSNQAELNDGQNTLTGSSIQYNSQQQTIMAQSNKKERVKMTFLPPKPTDNLNITGH